MDYEKESPKLNDRSRVIFSAFSKLNRRRVEYRPLQKNDILDEIEGIANIDKCLEIVENVDSYWLGKESEKMKRRMKK